MTNVQFYTIAVPIDVVEEGSDQQQPQTARSGLLDSDTGAVEHVSTDPEQDRLTATVRGDGAEKMAQEIEELARNDDIEPVPIFDGRGGTKRDGFYSAEFVRAGPSVRQIQEAYEAELRVRKKGTQQTHWRAIRTNATGIASANPFSSSDVAEVGIPSEANKRQWADLASGAREELQSSDVVRTESGGGETPSGSFDFDVDVVDVSASPLSTDSPTIVYEQAFDASVEGIHDPVVWDDRDGDKFDASGNLRWAHVFSPAHETDGDLTVNNGLLRLDFDEGNSNLVAHTWDSANGQWSFELATGGGWLLQDADVTHISPARVEAQLTWRDGSGGTGLFALDMALQRGLSNAIFTVPETESRSIPTELENELAPIASDQTTDAVPEAGVVDRGKVRRS